MEIENEDFEVEVVDPLAAEVVGATPRDSLAYIDTVVVMTRREPTEERKRPGHGQRWLLTA